MKKVVGQLLAVLLLATMMVGCASPGGYVIGPVSAFTARSNERAMVKRAALQSKKLNTQQKRDVVHATARMHNTDEIAVMVGVDVLALRGAKLTVAEIGKQTLGALGDAVLYGAIAYGLDEAGVFDFSSDDSSSSSQDINITVNEGEDTTVTVSGDTSSTSSSENNENNTQN
jgi:hypothetical protein